MDFFEELPGGGAPGVAGGEDENDEVGDGDEAFGDLLVLVLNGSAAVSMSTSALISSSTL
jgi:hypothetical protein